MELPVYRAPRWNNVVVTMINKAKIFVVDAGKVILVISLILWALSSFGPGAKRQELKDRYATQIKKHPDETAELSRQKPSALLECSYAGMLGKTLQPVIHPLGYDWKIGIALITSFAAREVFVGTMATLYSVGGGKNADPQTLQERMKSARREDGTRPSIHPCRPAALVSSDDVLCTGYAMHEDTLAVCASRNPAVGYQAPAIQLIYMTRSGLPDEPLGLSIA